MSTTLEPRSAPPSTPGLFFARGIPPTAKFMLLLWLVIAAAVTCLLWNNAALDTNAWLATRWFMGSQDTYDWNTLKVPDPAPAGTPWYYRGDPPLHGRLYNRTEKTWRLLRDFGEVQLTLVLFIAIWIFDRTGWRAALTFAAATSAAGLAATLIRVIAGRLRPNGMSESTGLFNSGGNYWTLFRGFYTTQDLSFPSGHSCLAFATAAVLIYFFPRGKYLYVTVAAGCALTRVIMQAHFYSDILVGSALGWTIGWLVAPRLHGFLSRC